MESFSSDTQLEYNSLSTTKERLSSESTKARNETERKLFGRSRWEGLLSETDINYCRENNIAIAYDCAQIGWVLASAEDETASIHNLQSPTVTAKQSLTQQIEALGAAFGKALSAELQSIDFSITSFSDIYDKSLALCKGYIDNFSASDSAQDLDRAHCSLLKELGGQLKKFQPAEGSFDSTFIYRPWKLEDIADYHKVLGNPKVWDYLPEEYPSPFTDELAKDLIEMANFGNHHSILAIEHDGEVIGQIRLMYNNDYPEVRMAEVAYILAEEYWGKGLMTHILRDFTRESFAMQKLDFIYAWIRADHPASAKCAEKAGYFRDNFAKEAEIAEIAQRPGFQRYISY